MKHFFLFCLTAGFCSLFAQRGGGGPGGGPGPGGPGPGGPGGGPNPPLASLKTIRPPAPAGLDRYVGNQQALVALGKALFWDMQTGSDGKTACATCHFHAGADHRNQNQLSGSATVNQTLTLGDFPFHLLSNTGNNGSAVVRDLRQTAGSAGVVERSFIDVLAGSPIDLSSVLAFNSKFQVNGISTRQVTGRNTPSVINAVFNVRNFWDGRANNIFSGATPFGDSDGSLNAWAYRDGALAQEAVRVDNASLASQAVGPALNPVEMSWAGRDWAKLGRKLVNLQPLGRQKVSPTDSVLGSMANADGYGLAPEWTYTALIQNAFNPEYWNAPDPIDGHSQLERNFGLFWGLAIQAYESTLIADDTRVDQFLEGNTSALTAVEQQGLQEFRNGGSQCLNCHNGPETSAAGFSNFQRRSGVFRNASDAGYFRIGVTPIEDDAGFGGKDDFGQLLAAQVGATATANGTFKAPSLRNVEFTGPYFHNGGQATLNQVLDFYGRNGDFPAGGNLGPGIGAIRLGPGDRNAIVAFLKALSDDRVKFQRAPFDHPSLCVPNGHGESSPGQLTLDPTQAGSVAVDKWALVPEVGRDGLTVPLQTFEELLQGIGNDGSRANTMTQECRP